MAFQIEFEKWFNTPTLVVAVITGLVSVTSSYFKFQKDLIKNEREINRLEHEIRVGKANLEEVERKHRAETAAMTAQNLAAQESLKAQHQQQVAELLERIRKISDHKEKMAELIRSEMEIQKRTSLNYNLPP